jgi:Ca2+-binding EF-hand superfamily protein
VNTAVEPGLRYVRHINQRDLNSGDRDYISGGLFAEFSVKNHQDSSSAEITVDLVTDSNTRVVKIQPITSSTTTGLNEAEQSNVTRPDIDLRAVDSEGRVTGVTEDGEFVNEIPGAKASGDRVQGPEWISVPADADVEFEVSTADAQKFVDETNVSEENATISYTTEITEVGENPKLVTENGTVTVTNTTTTTTNQSAEPGETKEVSTGFSVAQFDRDDDNQIGFDDLRFALREFNNGNITFDQLRRVLQAYNTGESV